jgi:outer membrane protein TolC
MKFFPRLMLVLGCSLAVACTAVGGEPWTLERALAQALAQNPDARIALHRVAAAQAGLAQANAAFWPRLQIESSYVRTDNPMRVFGSILNQRAFSDALDFNDVPDMDNLNAKGMVTMPLYSGGRNVANREAARASTEAARQDQQAVRNAVSFEVARAFHTVLKAREFIRAAEATVRAYETNVTIAQRRVESGTLLRTDRLDLEVRLAQAREDLVRARNALALATRVLRNLLGVEEGDLDVADRAPLVAAPELNDFSLRTELQAARLRTRAAEEQGRVVRSGYLPRVSAFGSLDYDYGWKYNQDGASYTAGVLAQWDIWDGHLTRAKALEARANLESAREDERRLRLAIDLEAEQARLDYRTASERLNVTQQSVDQAAESASQTRARFEQGLALPTQLMDAETALLGARVRRAEAEADARIAIAAWRKALGMPQLAGAEETPKP